MYIPLQLPVYWPSLAAHFSPQEIAPCRWIRARWWGPLWVSARTPRGLDWMDWRKIMNASPGSRIYIYICIYIYILANCKDQVGERMFKALQTEMGEYSFSSGWYNNPEELVDFSHVLGVLTVCKDNYIRLVLQYCVILCFFLTHQVIQVYGSSDKMRRTVFGASIFVATAGPVSSWKRIFPSHLAPEDTVRIWMDHFEENQLRVFPVFPHWAHWATQGFDPTLKNLKTPCGSLRMLTVLGNTDRFAGDSVNFSDYGVVQYWNSMEFPSLGMMEVVFVCIADGEFVPWISCVILTRIKSPSIPSCQNHGKHEQLDINIYQI